MTSFELYYRKFERKPQRHQIYKKFPLTMEGVFETLETADVDMKKTRFSNMI